MTDILWPGLAFSARGGGLERERAMRWGFANSYGTAVARVVRFSSLLFSGRQPRQWWRIKCVSSTLLHLLVTFR